MDQRGASYVRRVRPIIRQVFNYPLQSADCNVIHDDAKVPPIGCVIALNVVQHRCPGID